MLDPAITPSEAERAIEILEKTGLIKKLESGMYVQNEATISAAREISSLAIANFQSETIDFAKRALQTLKREERDISTITLTLSQESLQKARDAIATFRATCATIARDEEKPDRVFQCNIQLFPMTRRKGE
jgi:uncharacterized protein (TIGR02147 family)